MASLQHPCHSPIHTRFNTLHDGFPDSRCPADGLRIPSYCTDSLGNPYHGTTVVTSLPAIRATRCDPLDWSSLERIRLHMKLAETNYFKSKSRVCSPGPSMVASRVDLLLYCSGKYCCLPIRSSGAVGRDLALGTRR
jgi:hypothetical protein